MQSSEQLIQKAISEKWIYSLAFFYLVKVKYKNSSIYNYNSRSLGDKLNLSHTTITKHIGVLKEKGLIKKYGYNITLISTATKHKCTLNIKSNDNIKTIEKELLFKIVDCNFRQQQYCIDAKNEARNLTEKIKRPDSFISKKEYKKMQSFDFKKTLESSINNAISLTDKSLSIMLNVSTKQITKLKKYWKGLNYINYKAMFVRLYKCSRFFKEADNLFWFKGFVYQSLPTTYSLLVSYKVK